MKQVSNYNSQSGGILDTIADMQAKAEEPAKSDTTGSDFESCSSDEAQAHAADGADPHSSPVSPLWSPAKPVDRVAEESPSLDGLLSQIGLQSLGPVLEERVSFDRDVKNTKTLVYAARKAGVGQIGHIIITNPSSDSSLPYFNGKA